MRRRSRSAVSSVSVAQRRRRSSAPRSATGAGRPSRKPWAPWAPTGARLALRVRVAGELEHRLGLDALGDHERAALAGEGHDAEHHRARTAVLDRVGDDRAVDLDEVDRQRAEHLEPGVAGADVVERELEAEAAQARRLGEQQLLARVGALGDLEHDLVRLVAGAAHGEHEAVAREPVVLERLRRDVEEQQRVLRAARSAARSVARRQTASSSWPRPIESAISNASPGPASSRGRGRASAS